MVTELELVKAKPKRVLAYLKIISNVASSMKTDEEELKLTPSKEDLIIAREREFRKKIEGNVKNIEQSITKTLYHLNTKIHKAREVAMREPIGTASKRPLKRKGVSINIVNDNWVSANSTRLSEIHKIKQKIRLLEEKYLWLTNKGFDSNKMMLIQTRIDHAKDLLYLKLGSILEAMVKEKFVERRSTDDRHVLEKNVIGNLANGKYHRPACRSSKSMSKDNKKVIEDEKAAKKLGYKPCKICFPDK